VRFLIDEMFSPAVARHLTDRGHDAQHVSDLGLAGRTDDEVFERATVEDRVVVTENAVDFVALLDAAGSTGAVTPPVVLALKRTLPPDAGAMANELARRLARWADNHPDPYRHVHWLT
jgi:predicted nuclease of predicted toxin-antitoxin system